VKRAVRPITLDNIADPLSGFDKVMTIDGDAAPSRAPTYAGVGHDERCVELYPLLDDRLRRMTELRMDAAPGFPSPVREPKTQTLARDPKWRFTASLTSFACEDVSCIQVPGI
jgi:hypothetical protein